MELWEATDHFEFPLMTRLFLFGASGELRQFDVDGSSPVSVGTSHCRNVLIAVKCFGSVFTVIMNRQFLNII